MPHNIIRLSNGLKLIHKEIDAPIAHFGVLVNAGTRDESDTQLGMAHFVEHTIFKGTTHRNAFRVLSRMEDVGGDLNASTSKEETWFHSSFQYQDYPRAVELLSDIFFNATFPEKEIEREKSVVLEEINYYKDTPSELIFDDFEELVFSSHPLGKNILGTRQSVRKMKRDSILEFIAQHYTLENVVLSSVGKISTTRMVRLCERHFGCRAIAEGQQRREPFTTYTPQMRRVRKNTAQTNALLGNTAYAIRDDRRAPFMLLTNLLGGQGMNTRLNMRLREKHGLAYTVEATYTPFSDIGLFSIFFGCDPHNYDRCVELVNRELRDIREKRMGTLQLYYAQKQLIGQLALSNEARLNEMLSIGHTALFFDEVDTVEESVEEIRSITAEQILQVANEILIPDRFTSLVFEPSHGHAHRANEAVH